MSLWYSMQQIVCTPRDRGILKFVLMGRIQDLGHNGGGKGGI